MILGTLLAAVVGLALGLLGGGGSTLTVPILVYVVGLEVKQAIALSLAVVGVTSLFGAAGHWCAGNVNVRLAALFGVIAMAATYVGARLSVFLSGTAQLILFAAVMMVAAAFMFRNATADSPVGENGAAADGGVVARRMLIVIGAVTVGVLTGLVGVGGGFMIVPALVFAARVPMKTAVGTSLLVIAMNSAAGFAGYSGQVEVPWLFMSVFTGLSIVGILVGTHLVQYVSQSRLKRTFAVFLLLMGGFILIQNLVQEVTK